MDPLLIHRDSPTDRDALLAEIRDARFGERPFCPHCGSTHVQKWGTFSGRQRYRCRDEDCRKTFSDLTGTPLAYLKKLELLPEHARLLERGKILRIVAARLGIHISTAFRWRHRTLQALRVRDTESLSGSLRLRSEIFAESFKGGRHLPRPPRDHGLPIYEVGFVPHRRVVVATDPQRHVVATLLERSRVTAEELLRSLGPRIRGTPTVSAEQIHRGIARRFARHLGGRLDPNPPRPRRGRGTGPDGPDAGTPWAYGWRLKRWLVRFRGVATRYLPNYLIWRRRIDAAEGRSCGPALLGWPVSPMAA